MNEKDNRNRDGSVTSLTLGVGIVLGLLANELAAGILLGAVVGMVIEAHKHRNCK